MIRSAFLRWGIVFCLPLLGACGSRQARVPEGVELSWDCTTLPAVGASPFAIASGDWNGDGRLDVAVTCSGGGDLVTFHQEKKRGFRVGERSVVGRLPRGVVATDLNEDGALDLAVAAAEADALIVFEGNGRGGFGSRREHRSGPGPFHVLAADLDADGRQDVVVVDESNVPMAGMRGSVNVFFGEAGGELSSPLRLEAGGCPSAGALGDMDGDGRPDLAVVNWKSATLSLFRNQGERRFERLQDGEYGGAFAYGVAMGDLDGDGQVDLAISDVAAAAVHLRFGDGAGHFVREGKVPVGRGVRHVEMADLDGDGDLDLVTANTADGSVSVARNDGRGEFPRAQRVAVGKGPRTVHVVDLDADGRQDVLVTNMTEGTVSLLFGARSPGRACGSPP